VSEVRVSRAKWPLLKGKANRQKSYWLDSMQRDVGTIRESSLSFDRFALVNPFALEVGPNGKPILALS
jgi:hypothetical protein